MKLIARLFKIPKIFFWNFKARKQSGQHAAEYLNNYPVDYSKNHSKQTLEHWENYNFSGAKKDFDYKGKNKKQKMFYRVVVAVAIFLTVLMLRETDHPVGVQTREGLEYMLTTELDFQPAFDKAVKLGLQTVNMNEAFLNYLPGTSPVLAPQSINEYALPVFGKVIKPYGWIKDSADGLEYFNTGIYISSTPGTVVKASRSGRVIRIAEDKIRGSYILLDHGHNDFTLYAGLGEIFVQENQRVVANTQIAVVGDNQAGIPGVHFEIRENNKLVDPLQIFKNSLN